MRRIQTILAKSIPELRNQSEIILLHNLTVLQMIEPTRIKFNLKIHTNPKVPTPVIIPSSRPKFKIMVPRPLDSDDESSSSQKGLPKRQRLSPTPPSSPEPLDNNNDDYREHERDDDKVQSDASAEESLPAQDQVASSSSSLSAKKSTSRGCDNCSRTKFEEIEIQSKLLSTLKAVKAKHGNVIGEDAVRSMYIMGAALESLAKMLISMKDTTGRTLTNSQADEWNLLVLDLQHVGLKVDWLAPAVKKAVQLRKNKPIIESAMALEKEKAEVEEKERQFLAESAKRKRELSVRRFILLGMIPSAELMNLDDCLGEGLF